MSLLDRFKAKYSKQDTGCWEWGAAVTGSGYGGIKINGKMVGAHVAAYELFIGSVPEGLEIGHKCDNPLCVNPEHLEAITHQENMRQQKERDRHARGSRNVFAKLTEASVIEIKRLLDADVSGKDVAELFNVQPSAVSKIKLGKTWRHV